MKLATYLGGLRRKPETRLRGERVTAKKGVPAALIAVFLFLAVLIGMVGGLGSLPLVMIIGGGTIATVLFFLVNSYGLLLSLIVMTFLIQGSLLYFLGIKAATWVAVGMAMLFFVSILLQRTMLGRRKGEVKADPAAQSIIFTTVMFLLCFAGSLAMNRPPALQIVSAFKSFLPMFSVLLAFYWFRWETERLERLWNLLLIILILQLPVVLYQHFFIATAKTYDSIVGTFGGTPGGGGNSAIMVLFAITMTTYALARWNQGLMGRGRMILIVLIGIAVILLGEVKAAFVWLPFAAFWVLRKRILKNVFAMIGYTLLTGAFLAGTYTVYATLYWKNADKGNTVSEKFEARGGYFFDTKMMDYRTGEVSRGASLAIWANDPQSSLPRTLLGYGPGATKAGGALGAGTIAKRYAPLHIDATVVAILLWEVGIIGSLSYVSILISSAMVSRRIVANGNPSAKQIAILDTCTPMLVVTITTLIYNRALAEEPTAQLLLMFMLACVVQIARYGNLKWVSVRNKSRTKVNSANLVSA